LNNESLEFYYKPEPVNLALPVFESADMVILATLLSSTIKAANPIVTAAGELACSHVDVMILQEGANVG
jgi:hypothetical protein